MDFNDPGFAELLDALHDGVYITDHEGRTLKVNRAYERLTGLDGSQLVGRWMQDLVCEGVISRSASLKVIAEGQPFSLMQRLVNGKQLLVSASPIFAASGEIRYVISTVRDMTELLRMKHERDELQQLKQLRHSTAQLHARQLPSSLLNAGVATDELFDLAYRVAGRDVRVLLQGETGVGKTLVAQFIHNQSGRAAEPFLSLNCGALPEPLVEAELFGYAPGAFTGASSKGKRGLLELANHGTLFLDEIGDLPLALQVKLLKVLEEGRFIPVGGLELKEVDVRIISATHRDLRRMVAEGLFRADLFYRLNVVPLAIPPLRERRDEIRPLLEHYLAHFNQRHGRQLHWSLEALELLEQYAWPGNIRELINVVERLVALCAGEQIGSLDLPSECQAPLQDDTSPLSLRRLLERTERQAIGQALQRFKTTRLAAKALGISQATVVQKMKRWERD